MFINKSKRLKILGDRIEILSGDYSSNNVEIFKVMEDIIYIDKRIAFDIWKSMILKGVTDIKLTKGVLQQFIERYSEGVFSMVLKEDEAFKKLASIEDYDVEWLVELSEFVVNVEDKNKILKFIDNALKTKGNKFAFLEELLEALSFIEYMDKQFLDELLKRIAMFKDEVRVLKLKGLLARFM